MTTLAKKRRVITIGNEKGGVGKTTTVRILPFVLASKGYKCLVIDMDPQGNTTDSLFVTRMRHNKNEVTIFKKTLMKGIQEENINGLAVNVLKNLDFIPSSKDLKSFGPFLSKKFGVALEGEPDFKTIKQQQLNYFKKLIDSIDTDYDFIFFDTPPTASDFTNATAFVSDYIIMACQTQTDSLKGAKNYLNDTLIPLIDTFEANFEVIGILLNQLDKKGAVDNETLIEAMNIFGEDNVFDNIITYVKAVQNIPKKGITMQGYWNNKMFEEIFIPLTNEFLERIKIIEENE